MRKPIRVSTGAIFPCAMLGLSCHAMAQVGNDGGKTDPTQLQRNREILDLNPIERTKPEYEILSGPEQTPESDRNLKGVIIIPDQPPKTVPADNTTPAGLQPKSPVAP